MWDWGVVVWLWGVVQRSFWYYASQGLKQGFDLKPNLGGQHLALQVPTLVSTPLTALYRARLLRGFTLKVYKVFCA
jgi:hypothetical protein